MRRKRLGIVRPVVTTFVFTVGMLTALRASGITTVPTCPASGTLADLIALNGNATPGCLVGTLRYSGFSWTESAMSTTALAPNQVSFTTNPSQGVLDFNSSSFTVSGSNTLIYTLGYTIDPPPIIIRELDQNLFDDPPVFPGFARIPTTICVGASFSMTGTCSTSTVSLLTFDNGNGTTQFHDMTTFAPQSIIGVSTMIDLEARGASSTITGFGNTTDIVPEPSSYLLVVFGLAAVGTLRRKRSRLASISERKSD